MNIAARQPILVRELRQASRQGRTPWILGVLTLLLTLAMASVAAMMAANDAPLHVIGATLYQTFFALGTCVVVVVGATVAANGVASEHDGHTWEALLLSGLSPGAIAVGKFLSAYTQVATYLVVLAPVLALSFLVGGVTVTEVVVGLGLLLAVAALAVAFGLAMSSLVRSSRGALVATVLTTLVVGPVVYGLFIGAGVLGTGLVGGEIDPGPSWLALGIARAPFGLRYALVFLVDPLLALVLPGWFLFEITKASLTSTGDDRSSGLRRWFVTATLLLVAAALATIALAPSAHARGWVAAVSLVLVALHLGLVALVFAGEPLALSRRVAMVWARTGATFLRRALGPGIGRAMVVQAVVGSVALATIVGVGDRVVDPATLPRLTLVGLYAGGFHLFVVGLAGTLSVWTCRPTLARIVVIAVVALLVVVPLGVAEIVYASTGSSTARALGALSPAYPATIGHSPADLVLNVGFATAIGYGLIGVALVVATLVSIRRTNS